MAIDPNIALMAKGVQLPDLNAIAAQKQQLANNAFVMQQNQQKAQQEQALNAAYQQAYNPNTGQVDPNKLYSSLAQGGMGSAIPGQQRAFAQTTQAQAQASSAKLKNALDLLTAARQELGTAASPQEAKASLDRLAQQFPDMSAQILAQEAQIPADPSTFATWKTQKLAENLTAAQQLEQHFVNISDATGQRTVAMPAYGAGAATVVPGTEAGPKPLAPQVVWGQQGGYVFDPNTRTFTPATVPGSSGGGITPGEYGSKIESDVSNLVPGVVVTSRARTPQHNAAVGGVPDSYHLTDNARDFVPPKGMSMATLYNTVKSQLAPQGFDVINEGNHVHVEPGPSMAKRGGTQIQKAGTEGISPVELGPTDPESGSILAQTGLGMNAFLAITGQSSKLPRDRATRNAAQKQAEKFANERGIDVSTLGSQYDAYNKTLQSNIMRNNQTNILEQELAGTIQNIKPLADAAGLGRLNIANVGKLFAGKQVNDPTVIGYQQQLLMLQSELAGMNAAARGNIDQSGNVKTDQSDMNDAARVIMNGLSSGGADGLQSAVQNTVAKNRAVLEKNIDTSRKAIWGLFGVGKNYDQAHGKRSGPPASAVSYLKQHPNLRAQFDQKYGAGAAARALGQ